MKFTLDNDSMKVLSLFGFITKSKVKDCILEKERAVFVVMPGEISKAVGKQGANVRKLEQKFKRKIKIVEFNSDPKEFIKNLVIPAKVERIEGSDGQYVIMTKDSLSRGMIIGRGASMLRWYESIAKRYFPITEIKVK